MIEVMIDTDSRHPSGSRLTTFVLTYPRFIHSEFMTHAFARNAASTRAIPMKKQIEKVIQQGLSVVEFWGKNQSGMQALEKLSPDKKDFAIYQFADALDDAVAHAEKLLEHGVHKQIAGRILEPFSHITTVMTTEERNLRNFFALRAHKDAQPEFQVLAYRMLNAWLKHEPNKLNYGEWHLPLITDFDREAYPDHLLQISVARACWVSYTKHGKEGFALEDAIDRHDSAIQLGHMSVTQHQAQAMDEYCMGGHNRGQFGPAWMQYRKMIPNECRTPSDDELKEVLANKPDWIQL